MNINPDELICAGTGLLALDYIVNGNPLTKPKLQAGGSCGNVLAGLSYLGWKTYPIARLAKNKATKFLIEDLKNCNVNLNYISKSDDGSTPIIIHRIYKNKTGEIKHKFEFRNPQTKKWLPGYKPILLKYLSTIQSEKIDAKIFYLDKISAANIEMASQARANGAIVFFEPSGFKEHRLFQKCLDVCHILKYSNDRIGEIDTFFPNRSPFLEIETLGENGLRFKKYSSKNSKWHNMKPYKLTSIKDAAGAGDWCSIGIISTLAPKGIASLLSSNISELKVALNFGQALAALNCKFEGARGLMYYLKQEDIKKYITKIMNSKKISIEHDITPIKNYRMVDSFQDIFG
jgi:sugar/nucleoside kinase (ribokinase family)